MSRLTQNTSLRAACETCGSPAFDYCTDTDDDPVGRSHPARVAAAKRIPPVTRDQFDGLDRLAADPTAHLHRSVIGALVEKRWATPIDPPPGPTRTRLRKPPVRRHVLTEAGQDIRRLAGRCA